jgi:hypothetical protein
MGDVSVRKEEGGGKNGNYNNYYWDVQKQKLRSLKIGRGMV